MYVDRADTTVNDKTYTRYLLRTSYRERGKVRHRTLCTLPSRTPEDLKAIQAFQSIRRLDQLCALEMRRDGQTMCQVIPRPGPEQTALLDALGVQLPEALPRRKAVAATRHKLQPLRIDN
jgi:hypothetical protein